MSTVSTRNIVDLTISINIATVLIFEVTCGRFKVGLAKKGKLNKNGHEMVYYFTVIASFNVRTEVNARMYTQ